MHHMTLARMEPEVEAFSKSCRRTPLEHLRFQAVGLLRAIAATAAAEDEPEGQTLMVMHRLFDKVILSVTQGVERIKADELAEKARHAAEKPAVGVGPTIRAARVGRFREAFSAHADGPAPEVDCALLRTKTENAAATSYACWRTFSGVDLVALAEAMGREGLADIDFLVTEAVSELTIVKHIVSLARKLAE